MHLRGGSILSALEAVTSRGRGGEGEGGGGLSFPLSNVTECW